MSDFNLYANVLAALSGERQTDQDAIRQVAPNGISELLAWRDTAKVALRVGHEYRQLPPQLAVAVNRNLLGLCD